VKRGVTSSCPTYDAARRNPIPHQSHGCCHLPDH